MNDPSDLRPPLLRLRQECINRLNTTISKNIRSGQSASARSSWLIYWASAADRRPAAPAHSVDWIIVFQVKTITNGQTSRCHVHTAVFVQELIRKHSWRVLPPASTHSGRSCEAQSWRRLKPHKCLPPHFSWTLMCVHHHLFKVDIISPLDGAAEQTKHHDGKHLCF